MSEFTQESSVLVARIHAARARNDETAAAQALRELLTLYTRLGTRNVGTPEEQNAYIFPRFLGVLPQVLRGLGVRPEDLPEPPGRRRPAPPAADTARILGRLARLRPEDDDRPAGRYRAAYRPQDNVVVAGRLQPYAIVDTHDRDLPVAWYETLDVAETMADTANRMRSA
ncbi:hypothetical protein HHL19_35205 [Streptomyces sp. R302]|uniref:hypothetical protein n=1 Tax=unclassified Streptomyces TaxID=2593676 RepID=UPI00145CEDC7|nr:MULTISPECIES: hypothetical protein [unclassified Streptomyces]NML55209.1 hypothetical protein [Streptomyces sp. R301]NML83761.1 hypothetical protein [Streptomyces sp. R302]